MEIVITTTHLKIAKTLMILHNCIEIFQQGGLLENGSLEIGGLDDK